MFLLTRWRNAFVRIVTCRRKEVYWQKENKNNGWFSKRFTLWNLVIMKFFFSSKSLPGFRGYWINHLESPIMFIMLVNPASSFRRTIHAPRIYCGMLGHIHFLSIQPELAAGRLERCFGDSKAFGGLRKAHVQHTLHGLAVDSTVTRVVPLCR